MKVEVLYVAGCPSHPAAVKLVKEVLAAQGVVAEVREVLVHDERMARELKFAGSPTIRINGCDVDGGLPSGQPIGLSCRLYAGSKQSRLPAAILVQRAIAGASEGE